MAIGWGYQNVVRLLDLYSRFLKVFQYFFNLALDFWELNPLAVLVLSYLYLYLIKHAKSFVHSKNPITLSFQCAPLLSFIIDPEWKVLSRLKS